MIIKRVDNKSPTLPLQIIGIPILIISPIFVGDEACLEKTGLIKKTDASLKLKKVGTSNLFAGWTQIWFKFISYFLATFTWHFWASSLGDSVLYLFLLFSDIKRDQYRAICCQLCLMALESANRKKKKKPEAKARAPAPRYCFEGKVHITKIGSKVNYTNQDQGYMYCIVY